MCFEAGTHIVIRWLDLFIFILSVFFWNVLQLSLADNSFLGTSMRNQGPQMNCCITSAEELSTCQLFTGGWWRAAPCSHINWEGCQMQVLPPGVICPKEENTVISNGRCSDLTSVSFNSHAVLFLFPTDHYCLLQNSCFFWWNINWKWIFYKCLFFIRRANLYPVTSSLQDWHSAHVSRLSSMIKLMYLWIWALIVTAVGCDSFLVSEHLFKTHS